MPNYCVKQTDESVLVVSARTTPEWKQHFLMVADIHFDNPHCERRLFRRLLDEARELDEQAQAMRDEGNQVRALERARERRARLTDLANAGGRVIPDAPPKDGGL